MKKKIHRNSAYRHARRAKRKAKVAKAKIRTNQISLRPSEETIEVFIQMQMAENQGDRAGALVLLFKHLTSLTTHAPGPDPVAEQRVMIVIYDLWKNGELAHKPVWADPEFLRDYAEAATRAGYPGLIDLWNSEPDVLAALNGVVSENGI